MKYSKIAASAALAFCSSLSTAAVVVEVQDDLYDPGKKMVAEIRVDVSDILGPIKPMNAVNNGPSARLGPEQRRGDFVNRVQAYREARFPMARTHDSRGLSAPPGHMVDINAIFPDWDADENDPANYDFEQTDWHLLAIVEAGSEIMFRLGNSAYNDKYSYPAAKPPKSNIKWARVAERIIRHYNEGWGWTNPYIKFENQYKIRYWEIWNEPDLGCPPDYWRNPREYWLTYRRYWDAPPEKFYEFYATVAKYLKARFPHLKIGGPSVAGLPEWTDRFLAHCRANSVPLDFFSWHIYAKEIEPFLVKGKVMKDMLVKHGYAKTESILNEWNFNLGWKGDLMRASQAVRTDPSSPKMAAFYAGVMSAMQESGYADMLMYYDTRLPTTFNGVFNGITQRPLKGYFPFYAWSKLAEKGDFLRSTVSGRGHGVRATAAGGKDGSMAIMVSRYTFDENIVSSVPVRIRLSRGSFKGAVLHMTDKLDRYTESWYYLQKNGYMLFDLDPNAFAFIELPAGGKAVK